MVWGHSASTFKSETFLIPAVLSVSSETVPHILEVMDGLSQITWGFFPLAWYNTPLVL